jgi:hypothetical protein
VNSASSPSGNLYLSALFSKVFCFANDCAAFTLIAPFLGPFVRPAELTEPEYNNAIMSEGLGVPSQAATSFQELAAKNWQERS